MNEERADLRQRPEHLRGGDQEPAEGWLSRWYIEANPAARLLALDGKANAQSMKLSALTSSLPMTLPAAIEAIADLGFHWIDVPPTSDPAARRTLRDRELQVACVALERDLPGNVDLASEDAAVRSRSLAYFRQAIAWAAELNAPVGYFTPPVTTDRQAFARWTESLVLLADGAEAQGIRLCVEHFPRRALPTVAATLQFLDDLRHPALALLIDVGHCLISSENAAEAILEAGIRLGYLHFDDNNGVDDLHWALLDGRLTESQITAVIAAQRQSGYSGALCLELSPKLDRPLENLRRSRDVLHRCDTVGQAIH